MKYIIHLISSHRNLLFLGFVFVCVCVCVCQLFHHQRDIYCSEPCDYKHGKQYERV